MKNTAKIGIVFDAHFKSAANFESFLNRKPHWACYRLKEDLLYEIVVDCTLAEAKDLSRWKVLQDALEGNALCWDAYGDMRVVVDADFIGFKNGAFDKLCYSLYQMIPSRVGSTFGRSPYCPTLATTLLSDLATLGISPEFCPEIKQLIGKRLTESCVSNLELVDGKLLIKNIRSTRNHKRIVGIVEFIELVCMYCKGTSWESMDSINICEYLHRRVKSDFLKSIF